MFEKEGKYAKGFRISREFGPNVGAGKYALIGMLICLMAGVLAGVWLGKAVVLRQFQSLDLTTQEPKMVSDKVVTMDTLNFVYQQSAPYRPNDGYRDVYFGAQLFNSEDYIVYITDNSGVQYHTVLSQCKLEVNSEDPNTVHIKEFQGLEHPYIVFSMNAEEFSQNVSPLFMEGFTDGMVNFVYQYLAETLPLESESNA